MSIFDAADERFGHQIPEPFRSTEVHHQFWRESLFFIAQSPNGPDDVTILTLAHFPAREVMDSLQLGRFNDEPIVMRHERHVNGDYDDFSVGPVKIDIVEPKRVVRLVVEESPSAPVSMDLTFTARTAPYGLRRGSMRAGHEIIWDQRHMFQSGWFSGTVTRGGVTKTLDKWWGQRDHSWGIRNHARCPLWMWTPIQLEEGMLSIWHWEYPNGARVYTDGCFAPSDMSEPIPVIDFSHDLTWLDAHGNSTSYERFGDDVVGLAGRLTFTLQGGRRIVVDATGRWAQRYSFGGTKTPQTLGGGLSEMQVTTSDGARGTAIYEVTGQWHHRYFPLPRGEKFPPDAYSPGEDERAR
ncbi:MAG: hypothetical protein RIR38_859 [Actinomycetota bacterium]